MQNYLILVTSGIAAGVLAGFFGIGGGIILVPILVFGLGYAQHTANGTSLVALLLPVGILGVMEYYRAGKISPIEIRAGLLIAVGIFVGTFFGSRVALMLPAAVLRKGFSVFLVVVAVKMWLQQR